eukprot:CAMPEP_0177652728 /NCGR_PEP_ID=MMETSP0447-20121125/13298_1 /TAXON_ID=0 /ORGANISM="Stygamoeba regulata, Strain BSH-02190019" /LENGTH=609 /DNA_ID=CAMNT_0019156019 /DNA_START=408 /DNA_END=2234 /DNA_ORIENTATION=+
MELISAPAPAGSSPRKDQGCESGEAKYLAPSGPQTCSEVYDKPNDSSSTERVPEQVPVHSDAPSDAPSSQPGGAHEAVHSCVPWQPESSLGKASNGLSEPTLGNAKCDVQDEGVSCVAAEGHQTDTKSESSMNYNREVVAVFKPTDMPRNKTNGGRHAPASNQLSKILGVSQDEFTLANTAVMRAMEASKERVEALFARCMQLVMDQAERGFFSADYVVNGFEDHDTFRFLIEPWPRSVLLKKLEENGFTASEHPVTETSVAVHISWDEYRKTKKKIFKSGKKKFKKKIKKLQHKHERSMDGDYYVVLSPRPGDPRHTEHDSSSALEESSAEVDFSVSASPMEPPPRLIVNSHLWPVGDDSQSPAGRERSRSKKEKEEKKEEKKEKKKQRKKSSRKKEDEEGKKSARRRQEKKVRGNRKGTKSSEEWSSPSKKKKPKSHKDWKSSDEEGDSSEQPDDPKKSKKESRHSEERLHTIDHSKYDDHAGGKDKRKARKKTGKSQGQDYSLNGSSRESDRDKIKRNSRQKLSNSSSNSMEELGRNRGKHRPRRQLQASLSSDDESVHYRKSRLCRLCRKYGKDGSSSEFIDVGSKTHSRRQKKKRASSTSSSSS